MGLEQRKRAWVNTVLNKPKNEDEILAIAAAVCDGLHDAEAYMRFCGLETFGVETVYVGKDREHHIRYINRGDPRKPTVIQTQKIICNYMMFNIDSWSDWLDEFEREYEQNTGTIKCAYCGHFTPVPDECLDVPSETVCENCDHFVTG